MSEHTRQQLVQSHAVTIAALPEPPEEFMFKDIDMTMSLFHRLDQHGVLICASNRGKEETSTWRVEPAAYSVAVESAERIPRFSCCGRGTGIHNVDGDLVCKHCGAIVDEQEYLEVCDA